MQRRDLVKLPPDLMVMGWQWVSTESVAIHRGSTIWYKAVYVRPLDRDADDERAADVVEDNGQWWVRVTTQGAHSPSWGAAHEDAIALMRATDAARKS